MSVAAAAAEDNFTCNKCHVGFNKPEQLEEHMRGPMVNGQPNHYWSWGGGFCKFCKKEVYHTAEHKVIFRGYAHETKELICPDCASERGLEGNCIIYE